MYLQVKSVLKSNHNRTFKQVVLYQFGAQNSFFFVYFPPKHLQNTKE
jgi:uncharacterized membrane protein